MMTGMKANRKDQSGLRMKPFLFSDTLSNTIARHRQSIGGPKLKWYDVQPLLGQSESDVLLILDCCHAAQAARASLRLPKTIELLASAAKGVRTPLAGPRSFTTALIKEMQSAISGSGSITVSSLHARLCSRGANLVETPIHVKLKSGQRERSIKLQPMLDILDASSYLGSTASFDLHVSLQQPLQMHHLDEIAGWLKHDTPNIVRGLSVMNILEKTSQMQQEMANIQRGASSMSRSISVTVQEDILNAWDDIAQLVCSYVAQHLSQAARTSKLDLLTSRAERFVRELRAQNDLFQGRVSRCVLNSGAIIDESALEETTSDSFADVFGLSDALRLRRMVKFGQTSGIDAPNSLYHPSSNAVPSFEEYKYYESNENADAIRIASERMAALAVILGESRCGGFRSLRCLGWTQDCDNSRFILQFEVPAKYLTNLSSKMSLYECIQTMKRSSRPTLGERFRMAYSLAKALEGWHAIDWVHQGISGRNTVIFTSDSGKLDYAGPYMQGFDFARPNVSPSNGRYVDDVEANVYRHPDRQGLCRQGHKKVHDIYALGVVLLEIGLWQDALSIVKKRDLTVNGMKDSLVKAASERLGLYAGKAYQTAIIACLTGSLAVEMDDVHETHLAKSFQTNVVDELLPSLNIY